MSISESYRCARAMEAIENYAKADDPLVKGVEDSAPSPGREIYHCYEGDETFWHLVLTPQGLSWGAEVELFRFALSEWIARVPGLYWSKGAKTLRELAKDSVELKSDRWVTYSPLGKSQIVLGGVGTLKFPPDENGRRLVTISGGHNASSGIPALVFPDVWEQHKLREGCVLTVRAQWQKMSLGWAERFPSIRGIPRGYLVIRHPEQVNVIETDQPTEFHPFTVMEYSKGDAKLWDFVYATADTRVENYRKKLENFFTAYKDKRERYGRYLLASDINDPLWEAEFNSPSNLRRAEAGSEAQLDLLQTRVRKLSFRGKEIEEIVQVLVHHYDNDSLQMISDHIAIPKAQWFMDSSVADSAVAFVQQCVERNKVEELLDAVAQNYPGIF